MIQFNLLPDIKVEYMRTQRVKRTVMLVSGVVSVVAFLIFLILLLNVQLFQKGYINDLTDDINAAKSNLNGTEGINQILTVQNQLNSLDSLHQQKPAMTRLIGFMGQVTPVNVSISTLNVSTPESTISITGSADTLASVNKFVDTLKFTKFRVGAEEQDVAFSEVVLSSFGRSQTESTYAVDFKYNPLLFDNKSDVSLVIPPGFVTTRSVINTPDIDSLINNSSDPLFEQSTQPIEEGAE